MQHLMRVPGMLVIALLLLTACAGESGDTESGSSPQEGYVTANGVRLQYLDWGGSGPALVLVHGLGASPRFFDPLAMLLRDDFRVIAYARRGHGQSDAPDGPYDNATLVEDLRQLLDTLEITQTHLLGWSMGGNEITEFAGVYPDRTLRLVYLEAGYDWSDPAFLAALTVSPITVIPDSATLQSLDAYRAWFQELFLPDIPWTPALEACLRDVTRISSDGSVQPIPTPPVLERLFASLAATPRDYGRIRTPALALYAASHFAAPVDPDVAQALAAWEEASMAPFRRASMERMRRELSDVTIVQMANTTHASMVLAQPDSLAATLRAFLARGT